MFLKIADFKFDIKNQGEYIEKKTVDYHGDSISEIADYCFEITAEEIDIEKSLAEKALPRGYFEQVITYRKIAEWIPSNNSILFHCACFDIDGVGVAFAAHSGTGKTTHMNLWQKLLGDKMVVVNGDKPIVRFFDDEPKIPYAYGTPWNGKEGLGCNMRTRLKHICFIERGETNYVTTLDKAEAISRIMKQIYMPKDNAALMKTLALVDRLLSNCNLWVIHCNMDIESAEVAYNAIFGV